jgi:hypothetical protein
MHKESCVNLRSTLYPVLVLFLALTAWLPAAQAEAPGVIIQVSDNDPERWTLALNNAKNFQKDLGKNNVNIEIVAYGPGINMLKKDSKVAKRLVEAKEQGITVLACENTMRNKKVSRDQMHTQISYIDSGVVEIMNKQRAGWAYLRP